MNSLRQVGIAFHMFAHDHNNAFPMAIPAGLGGSMDSAPGTQRVIGDFFFGFRHFQALSNELVTPRLLSCPSDDRLPASSFQALEYQNVSYFVGLKADYRKPQSILAGDRNITNDLAGSASLLPQEPNQHWRWTSGLHQLQGNLLFADSSVQASRNLRWPADAEQPAQPTAFALPTVKSPTGRSPPISGLAGNSVSDSGDGGQSQTTRKAAPSLRIPSGLLAGVSIQLLQTKTPPPAPEPVPSKRPHAPTNLVQQPKAPASSPLEPDASASTRALGLVVIRRWLVENAWLFLLVLLLLLAMGVAAELRRRLRAAKRNSQASGCKLEP